MAGNVHTVGAIRIAILSKTAEFTRGLRSTLQGMDKMRSKARRVSRAIQRHWRMATAAVAGLSAALAFGVKRMTDYSSKLVEMARAAGMSTSQLENMRALLQGDGIGIARTDKAMQEFTVRLGFAQRGIGQYTRSFEEMGVAVANQDGTLRNQTEVLRDVADAIQKTSSHSTAASYAYELFGRSGKELVPILQKYGDKLADAAEHAGRFRTLTDEQHLKNKELGQSIFELSENMSDLVQKGLALAAPHLKSIVDDFNDWIVAIKSDEGTMEGLKAFAEGLGKAFAFVAKMIAVVITGFGYMFKAVKTLSEVVADLFTESFAEARENYVKAGQALEDHIKRGPLVLPSGKVTTAAQTVFDETTNRLEAEVARTRSIFDVKQAEIRAAQHGKTLDELVKRLVPPMEAAIETGAEEGVKKALETATGAHLPAAPFRMSGPGAPFPMTLEDFQNFDRRAWREEYDYNRRRRDMGDAWHRQRQIWRVGFQEILRAGGPYNPNAGWGGLIRPQPRPGWNNSASFGAAAYPDVQMAFGNRVPGYDPNAGMASLGRFRNFGGSSSGAIGGFFRNRSTLGEGMMILDMKDGVAVAIPRPPKYNPNAGLASSRRIFNWMNRISGGGASAGALGGFDIFGDPQMAFGDRPASTGMGRRWGRELRDYYSGERRIRAAMQAPGMLGEDIDDLRPILNDAHAAFSSFADSLVDGFDNAADSVRSFAKELVKIGIRRLLINPAADALFGTSDGSEAGLFGRVFARADGGHTPRGMALVGERGPELVDFSRPGMVYTNEQLSAAMAGGRAVNIVYNIASTDGPGVRAALAEATPGIVVAAQASVAESASRPGAFRQAVRGR